MTLHGALQTIKPIATRNQAAAIRSTRRPLKWLLLLLTAALVSASVTNAASYSPSARISRTRSAPVAVAAREMTLHETGNLHLVSHHHTQLVEEGHGTGTLSGSIIVKITLAFSQASITFTAYPSTGGTVIGRGEGKLYAGGRKANFSGTATITGGTGRYAHASGHNIHLAGTLQRKTFALYVRVEGKMRY